MDPLILASVSPFVLSGINMSVEKAHPTSRLPLPVRPERSEAKSKDALMPPVRLSRGHWRRARQAPGAVYGISSPPLTPTTCPVM